MVLAHLFTSFGQRWSYGFDLEWMEGGMLVHVDRLRNGQGLYVEPSADFIPYIYPPFYPWVLSVLGEPSYSVGRLVSIGGTFAAMGAAVVALRQERIGWAFAIAPIALAVAPSCSESPRARATRASHHAPWLALLFAIFHRRAASDNRDRPCDRWQFNNLLLARAHQVCTQSQPDAQDSAAVHAPAALVVRAGERG